MAEVTEQYNELVRYVVEGLIGTDNFVVRTTDNTGSFRIELDVPADQRGRVIGKSGRIAKSIRTILESASFAAGPVTLDIVD